jgi:hypothetical protein
MLQDLETIAPSVIVCAAFLVAIIALLRHEMAPRRRGRGQSQTDHREGAQREDPGRTEL